MRALRQRDKRAEFGRFLAEGVRVVEDLIESQLPVYWVVTASTLEDTPRGRALVERIDARGIPRRVLPEREFRALADTEAPQGVTAVAGAPSFRLDDLEWPDSPRPHPVLVFDSVQDPGNLGTMIRSAEAFGAAAIIALPGTVDPWNPKAVRAAAGSSFRVPIIAATWSEARDRLGGLGFLLLGADASGEPLGEPPPRAALVVGNEGSGLSSEIASSVDRMVGIPTPGRAESLNVTAAAAILLYELAGRGRTGAAGEAE